MSVWGYKILHYTTVLWSALLLLITISPLINMRQQLSLLWLPRAAEALQRDQCWTRICKLNVKSPIWEGIALSTSEPHSNKGDALAATAELLKWSCARDPELQIPSLWPPCFALALGVPVPWGGAAGDTSSSFPALCSVTSSFKPTQWEQSPSTASQGAFCGAFRMFFVSGEVL